MSRATIRSHCDLCGDVSLVAEEITLRRCIDRPSASTYRFRCPDCHKIQVTAAHARVVDLLAGTRVQFESFYFPAAEVHEGPPLSIDDLLDLRLELDSL